ncbi:MAG: hypothetical protein A2527_14710 [Candidatus Lambdaproteobacteria bacterium RIFOXYD2_FULL_50_16]|uniref:Filamentation induced by cAMP protein Fic-like C-terminal domain-containing protein n=1 Tax=Candidatus Lambdaproteobacteria bacterium RIFOXYD2_FULL_50_16 TaxID=1817772 RepID=A0A1F6G5P9_9PROT|nr:MAG: hypothetical protein A2527_14710 [Candidatus Lambdaproteobacteria bacterium RIFOXYD2_FULL_50_16]
MLAALSNGPLGIGELMQKLELKHRQNFRNSYLNPALVSEWIERTQPQTPNSPTQQYRLTTQGKLVIKQQAKRKR